MANPYTAAPVPAPQRSHSIYRDKYILAKYRGIDDAIHRRDLGYLRAHLMRHAGPVNLSRDSLLSVLIAYGETEMVVELVREMPVEELLAANYNGDTALHVAAAHGNKLAAEALIGGNGELVEVRNGQQEIALHKAALFGERGVFWKLLEWGSNVNARRVDGANVLHCAIMGNAPKLALEIALQYPNLMFSRNSRAVTPLQLVVTIPQAFRSRLLLGPLESLIYHWIPLEEESTTTFNMSEDVEKPAMHDTSDQSDQPVGVVDNGEDLISAVMRSRKKFPSNYAICFGLLELACIPVRWTQLLFLDVLKHLSPNVRLLEQQKKHHREAMKLIDHMARDPEYWDFIDKGWTPRNGSHAPPTEALRFSPRGVNPDQQEHVPNQIRPSLISESFGAGYTDPISPFNSLQDNMHQQEHVMQQNDSTKNANSTRWDESPLILGAKMGLHEFVHQILTVCPGSVECLDTDGRNVLQVAIQNGHEEIVEIVESMATGTNPVLPSWLLSSIDQNTKNTILHFAAAETVKAEAASALQMQHELQWFERVKKLVPKDLENSRNESEKTAQELFTENHKDMVKSGKDQLMEMGKTCSSLVAAVVFASSFSIPGEKDANNNPVFQHKIAFKVFSHTYVIGLSCASMALVLFLSLLTSRYREQDFRRSLPTKYFFANMSFFLALVALLVAFSCNIYLNIYGGRRAETKDIVPLVCELTIFPAVCGIVLLYRGSTFGLEFVRNVWR